MDYDKIIFCPKCMTRQNFNFGGTGIGVCMVCSARIGDDVVQPLGALALYEYEEEEKLKRAIKERLNNIMEV